MHVIATAGHVDHGKSTLVRALTGMEPDRWAEERRRGMTIDLGYAWTALTDGTEVAFVDVPGHQRFVSNMLAGIGPVPAVLLVVAADEGWSRQTDEHVAALTALDVRHGVLAVTRSDLGDAELAMEEARDYLADTPLAAIEAVAVSPVAGTGLDEMRAALSRLVGALPPPPPLPTRLWIDRVFSVRGAGTVLTGTLSTGSIAVGEQLRLAPRNATVHVRGLESLKQQRTEVSAVARVAVNLRGVGADEIRRGDALVVPEGWLNASVLDVRLVRPDETMPREMILHIGSAAVPARVRRLGSLNARLTLSVPLPVRVGDRGLLRDPGRQRIAAGAVVLDVLVPTLRGRGAAVRRTADLDRMTGTPDAASEVTRRGTVRRSDLARAGIEVGLDDAGVSRSDIIVSVGDWLVERRVWESWQTAVSDAAIAWADEHPLSPSVPRSSLVRSLGLPDSALLAPLVAEVDTVRIEGGGVLHVNAAVTFDPATESALSSLEQRLAAAPFDAPGANELAASGLTEQHLAAAARAGRLVRLDAGLYLRPDVLETAVNVLRRLPQPFTLSQARDSFATTRRVTVPLLELLDRRGYTRRVDDTHREVRASHVQEQV